MPKPKIFPCWEKKISFQIRSPWSGQAKAKITFVKQHVRLLNWLLGCLQKVQCLTGSLSGLSQFLKVRMWKTQNNLCNIRVKKTCSSNTLLWILDCLGFSDSDVMYLSQLECPTRALKTWKLEPKLEISSSSQVKFDHYQFQVFKFKTWRTQKFQVKFEKLQTWTRFIKIYCQINQERT